MKKGTLELRSEEFPCPGLPSFNLTTHTHFRARSILSITSKPSAKCGRFPETDGKRVNFCQLGLTAQVYVESPNTGDLADGETYFLMPCDDGALRPLRMKAVRRLTLDEFRMSHITAQRLAVKLSGARRVMGEIHMQILGPEVLEDSA